MKAKYFCDFCRKDFDDENECLEHEKLHGIIKKLVKKNPSKYDVGDRVKTLGCNTLSQIKSKEYDVSDGWRYDIGVDDMLHSIIIRESNVSGVVRLDEIRAMEKAMNGYLFKHVSNQFYAKYDKSDDEELSFKVRFDEKLPYAVKLLKAHIKDEAKNDTDRTEHALYFPSMSKIVLIEFSTFIPKSNELGTFMGYEPSKKFPYRIEFTMCAAEQYNDVLEGKIAIPDNITAGVEHAIDLIDFI